jgi:glycosyltransferase involved in cell wall biosynthesis
MHESDRVKVFTQNNKGASAARNTGLKMAGGEYIQFLDSDDLLDKNKITSQVILLELNPGKVSVCSTVHFPDGCNPIDFKPSAYEEAFLLDSEPVPFLINLWGGNSSKGSMIQPNAWLTPKHLIDKAGYWNEDISLDDDGEFFCRVILNSKGIIKANGYSYYRKYNNENKNLSAQQSKEAIESAFKSILSKKEQLAVFDRSAAGQRAIYNQLLPLALKSYLVYPTLYQLIKKELKTYPAFHPTPVLGGPLINFIAKVFGWKIARKIQYYHSNFFKI